MVSSVTRVRIINEQRLRRYGVSKGRRGARGGRGEHDPRPERATAAGERRADLPPAAKEKIHKTTKSAIILCEKCLLISCVC